jgi:hypothetical protein
VQQGSPDGISVEVVLGAESDFSNCAIPPRSDQELGRAIISGGTISLSGFMAEGSVSDDDEYPDCGVGRRTTTHTESVGPETYQTSFVIPNPAYVRLVYSVHRNGSGGSSLPFSCSECDFGCNADVNSDGNADQDDVAAVIDCVAGAGNLRCCDINGDGNSDQDDVAEIIDRVSGAGC